jgi:FKBP-type peptidyl-prolyl cis-trans isomerase 2
MNKRTRCSILAVSLILGGCGTKTIQTWDTVSIVMTGSFEDKGLFENATKTITVGSWEVISGVEAALLWMKKWEQKTIIVTPENGYAKEYKANNIQKISKGLFDKIQKPSTHSWEINFGNLTGTIKGTEKDGSWNDIVIFDLNPAQTRQTLTYDISVTDVISANK